MAYTPTVGDSVERWLARMEQAIDSVEGRLAAHAERPYHTSYDELHRQVMERLCRIEAFIMSAGKWMILSLFLIVGVTVAILGVVWKILEAKPAGG